MPDPIPAAEHVAETIVADAEHVAAAADPQVAEAVTVAHDAEHVAAEVEADAPAAEQTAERTIASVSRNADGTIREAGARLVGDRDELVGYFHRQLLGIAGHWHTAEDLLHRAAAEVDAMLRGHRPPSEPIVAVDNSGAAPKVLGHATPPAAPAS